MSARVGRLFAGVWGLGIVFGLAALGAGRAAAEPTRYTLAGKEVVIYNLVGSVEIVPGTGSSVVAEVTLQGPDASRLKTLNGPVRGRSALRIIYPGDRVVVPAMGAHSTTTLRVRDDGTFGDDDKSDRGDRMVLSGSGPGIEARADMRILVPPGANLSVRWGTGEATVARVDAEVSLHGASMPVRGESLHGSFNADIGSGSVEILGSDAPVTVDTGSGRVHLRDVKTKDRISVDTGSGEIDGENLSAAALEIDSGSGSITLENVDSRAVTVDTGSGEIDVDLNGDVSTLVLESGSGDVTVAVPKGAGAQLSVETGSGGIRTELALESQVRKHGSLVGRLGDGRGTIDIETGSGTVTLRERKL